MKIGLISDTHAFLDERIGHFFTSCDEIWHAGDIGSEEVISGLEKIAPVVAVHGNIDGGALKVSYPEHQRFQREGFDIWITHIGGYPKRYDKRVYETIYKHPPDIFICGHSHIVKVIRDQKLGLLHINPGAAGKYGFHKVRTIARMIIKDKKISDLEVIELGSKTKSLK